jgi:beta-glucosidase-like glycosyl hydrolase
MGFTGTVVSDYNGIGWAQTRQHVASSPEEVGALGVSAGMDVEAPSPYGYGSALVRAVERGLLSETQLDESVRRVLRDKFALGLFENSYVAEDPVEIRARAGEGDELSRRLSDEAVTLLKNEGGLLPLGRDVRKVAVIGPHADSVMVGFPQYSYPAGVAMIRVAAKLGFFPPVRGRGDSAGGYGVGPDGGDRWAAARSAECPAGPISSPRPTSSASSAGRGPTGGRRVASARAAAAKIANSGGSTTIASVW